MSALYSRFHVVSESPAVQFKSTEVVVPFDEAIPIGTTQVGLSNKVTSIFDQSASEPPKL